MSDKKTLTIVKIGGHVIANEEMLHQFLQQFAQINGDKILVHGGGSSASQLLQKLGIQEQKHEGRRITDGKTLGAIVMVYAGRVNKGIVATLQSLGVNAMGITGADGNAISAKKRPIKPIDFGFVGDVTADGVNTTLFNQLLQIGITPVVAPLTHNGEGVILNTNADTIAAQIAIAMQTQRKVRLLYAFEQDGVWGDLKTRTCLPELNVKLKSKLYQEGVIADGMLPKLKNAFEAVDNHVEEVRILNFEALLAWQAGHAPGTQIVE